MRDIKKLARLTSVRKAQLDAATSRLEITQSYVNLLGERGRSFERVREKAVAEIHDALKRADIDGARIAGLACYGLPEAIKKNREREIAGRRELARTSEQFQAARQNYEQVCTLADAAKEAAKIAKQKEEQRELDGRFLFLRASKRKWPVLATS